MDNYGGGNSPNGVGDGESGGGENRTNLIINYLPSNMTQDEVQSLFAAMGDIQSCKLVCDKATNQSLGFAFVNFQNPESAQKAVMTLNGLRLQNKTIKVSLARPSSENIKGANLYVSGLPKTMTQQELEALFSSYGDVVTTRVLFDTVTGLSKGVGFVRFNNKPESELAIEKLNGVIPTGGTEPITVKYANNPSNKTANQGGGAPIYPFQMLGSTASQNLLGPIHQSSMGKYRYTPLAGGGRTGGTGSANTSGDAMTSNWAASATTASMMGGGAAPGYTLFVYNLDPEAEETILWQLFAPFGAVLTVKLIKDPATGKGKGYGFVTMRHYEEAVVAINSLNGSTVANRVLQVSFKTQKSVPPPSAAAAAAAAAYGYAQYATGATQHSNPGAWATQQKNE